MGPLMRGTSRMPCCLCCLARFREVVPHRHFTCICAVLCMMQNMAWGGPLASGQAPGNARAWEAAPVSSNAAFWSQVVQQVDHHCHTHHHHFYHHSVEQAHRQVGKGSA